MNYDASNIDALNSVAASIKYMAQPGQFYFDECLPFYLKALEVDPDDFETNFNIALLYYDQKR